MFIKVSNNNITFLEFIISIKVDSSWFERYKLRSLHDLWDNVTGYVDEGPPAVDSVGVNSKE